MYKNIVKVVKKKKVVKSSLLMELVLFGPMFISFNANEENL